MASEQWESPGLGHTTRPGDPATWQRYGFGPPGGGVLDLITGFAPVIAPFLGGPLGDAGIGSEAGATVATSMPPAIPEIDPTFGGALQQTSPGVFSAAAPAGAAAFGSALGEEGMGAGSGAVGADVMPSGGSFLPATMPTTALDPSTAAALGITFSPQIPGEFGAIESSTGFMPGGAPTFGEGAGGFPGEPTGQWGGPTGMGAGEVGAAESAAAWLKKLGLTPATAGLLGISGLQALSKPKLPQAAQDLQKTGAAGATAASGVIQSGGTSGPAWAQQKSSIDATIDQQVKEQIQAMLQQAQNSGMGADSQVTQQQVNKIKNQAETMRQQMYAQAQAQNVQAALQQLGISDQALAQVANTQFQQSAQARQGAAQTASLALMLATLGKA